jgi:hypothetical protein
LVTAGTKELVRHPPGGGLHQSMALCVDTHAIIVTNDVVEIPRGLNSHIPKDSRHAILGVWLVEFTLYLLLASSYCDM